MKKILVLFLVFCGIIVSANAQYVRKIREPNFFIPEKDKLHKPEKLPEIYKKKNVQYYGNFENIPQYKLVYENYLRNILIFKTTKKLNEDKILIRDLRAMQSNEKIAFTGKLPNKITTKEQKMFYELTKKIIKN